MQYLEITILITDTLLSGETVAEGIVDLQLAEAKEQLQHLQKMYEQQQISAAQLETRHLADSNKVIHNSCVALLLIIIMLPNIINSDYHNFVN